MSELDDQPGAASRSAPAASGPVGATPDGAVASAADGVGTGTPVAETTTTLDDQPRPTSETEDAAHHSALFGRGLLYVVVSSLQFVTGAIASPILAHLLDSPAEFGALSSAIALHQLLIVFALVGLDQAVVLKRGQDGHDGEVRSLAGSAFLIVVAVTAVLLGTARWWAGPLGFEAGLSPLVLITVVWTVPSAMVVVLLGLLLAQDRLRPYSWVSLLAVVGGQTTGVVLALTVARTAPAYAWGLVAADTVAALVAVVLTRPKLRGAVSPTILRPALALGLPLMLGSLSSFVLNAGDRIVIQRIAGAAEVGRYQIAYTVGFVALQLLNQTSSAWTPRFAAVADEASRWRLIGTSRNSLFRVLSPVLLGVVLASPVVLRVFAPASFRPEGLLVVVLLVVASAYPVTAAGATSKMLVTARRTRPLAIWAATAASVNLVLNIALVPRFGIEGAAFATLLAYLVLAGGQRWSVRGRPYWPGTATVVKVEIVVVLLVATATTLLPQTTVWNWSRFALAVACLPWFWVRLRQARTPS